MAVTTKSPGVYIEEISVLPPSVAPVATGIPAFVGYTDIALDENGGSLAFKPKRITSMIEYERFFGKANTETMTVSVSDLLDNSNVLLSRNIAVTIGSLSEYKLYYSMQLYFANGGGPCYIVSVGNYSTAVAKEVTPGVGGILAGIKALEKEDEPTIILFPDAVGVDAIADYGDIVKAALAQCAKLQDRVVIADVYGNAATATAVNGTGNFRDVLGMNNLKYGAVYAPFLNTTMGYAHTDTSVTFTQTVQVGTGSPTTTPSAAISTIVNTPLYAQIQSAINLQKPVVLPPSGGIAGVYASVDRDRGVWKAPANVSLNLVSAPSKFITTEQQDDLNIDPSTGKSINAIRAFAGKGTLVWGARTLAGNDNEWRYVNVRRLFNFMEESIKKATESVVFEPNDANTWLRVKGTITNFLTNLWRDGALVGAKPEQAFFVKVGLNETMTAQDILEGKLIIQIGAAASRPAEFIVLQFMHKLQES